MRTNWVYKKSYTDRIFRHVGHIGYTPGAGFSVNNNDPEMKGILEQLEALGISADEIDENQEFIQEFLQQNNQQQPQQRAPIAPSPPNVGQRKKAPPPPPGLFTFLKENTRF